MRQWVVGSALIEGPDGILLVQNKRRDGRLEWSPPGGVIDAGETVLDGLTREVLEETGLVVTGWEGPLYEVEAEAAGMGWHLKVEVHRATAFEGEVSVGADPDGIVVDARFVHVDDCHVPLASTWLPTTEPLTAWLSERWTDVRAYRYRIDGPGRDVMTITRL